MKYTELIKFIRVNKIIILFLSCLFFTLLYTLIDDNHFKGLNQVKDITKDEIIKKEVEKDVEEVSKENFDNYDNYISKELEKEKNIDVSTKTTKKEVEQQELDPSQINPNIIQKTFNRLYFSISTGCLVGYGDIYPITNISKTLSIVQSLLTVSLILA
jgi:hypothetical protein